jgi:hypothetical protein
VIDIFSLDFDLIHIKSFGEECVGVVSLGGKGSTCTPGMVDADVDRLRLLVVSRFTKHAESTIKS